MVRSFWAILLAGLFTLPGSGCGDQSPCPLGQVRVDGECTDLVGDASAICGAGTYYNAHDDACFADPAEICGPGTEVEWVLDDNGLPTTSFVCRGTGNIVEPPACPDAQPGGTICINGFIKYLMDPDDPTTFMEKPAVFDSPTVTVRVYDPLMFAVNPGVAPLGENTVVVPEDGTFKVENVAVPGTTYVAVVVDDDEATGADDFAFTGYAYAAAAGVNLLKVDAYTVSMAQNQAWTDAIGQAALTGGGCAAGATLMDCATWIGVFGYRDGDGNLTTIEGVVPTKLPGPSPIAGERVFFLNDDYASFTAGPGSTTPTGVAFYVTASLGAYAGQCAAGSPCESEGYTWPADGTTGGSAPGALFVQLMEPKGLE